MATRQAFVARSWHPNGPIQPLALVKPEAARTNVAPAYFSAGFDIVPLAGEVPAKKRGGGGGYHSKRDPWEDPTSGEDKTLNALWRRRGREGWWLAEVPIGTGAPRRIDAVVVPWSEPRHSRGGGDVGEFRKAVTRDLDAELVEA